MLWKKPTRHWAADADPGPAIVHAGEMPKADFYVQNTFLPIMWSGNVGGTIYPWLHTPATLRDCYEHVPRCTYLSWARWSSQQDNKSRQAKTQLCPLGWEEYVTNIHMGPYLKCYMMCGCLLVLASSAILLPCVFVHVFCKQLTPGANKTQKRCQKKLESRIQVVTKVVDESVLIFWEWILLNWASFPSFPLWRGQIWVNTNVIIGL